MVKEKTFKPFLLPNDKVDLQTLTYPLLVSTKLDGIRIIFYKGKILTRSLKPLPNKQLNIKFEPLRKFTEDSQVILDGEIYSHDLNFQDIISFCITDDFEDPKSIKKLGCIKEIPESLKFYCFDGVKEDQFDEPFGMRYINNVNKWCQKFPNLMKEVKQESVNSSEEVEKYFEGALEQGYEGLVLKSLDGYYKCGRATIKENLAYKVKSFVDFDGQIIEVIQATKVDETVEKIINELGRSVTSRKKNDRILVEKASAFKVLYEGKELKVTLAMTDEYKEKVWVNKDDYIGKWICYKGMLIGAKDVPRHPVFLRFREPKE